MQSDRQDRQGQKSRRALGDVPMHFGGFTARDMKLYSTEEALHAVMGVKVLVPVHRMRGARG